MDRLYLEHSAVPRPARIYRLAAFQGPENRAEFAPRRWRIFTRIPVRAVRGGIECGSSRWRADRVRYCQPCLHRRLFYHSAPPARSQWCGFLVAGLAAGDADQNTRSRPAGMAQPPALLRSGARWPQTPVYFFALGWPRQPPLPDRVFWRYGSELGIAG